MITISIVDNNRKFNEIGDAGAERLVASWGNRVVSYGPAWNIPIDLFSGLVLEPQDMFAGLSLLRRY